MLAFFPLISPVVPTAVTAAFVQETDKTVILSCLVTLLPQVLAMTAFIQHFIKGFGNHESEKCEYTNLLPPCVLPPATRNRNDRAVKTMPG